MLYVQFLCFDYSLSYLAEVKYVHRDVACRLVDNSLKIVK